MEPHPTTVVAKKTPVIFHILAIGLTLLLLFCLNQFFQIKAIDCQSANQPCSSQTLAKLEKLKNHSLFFTNFDETLSEFKVIKLTKQLPSTLKLTLEEATQENYAVIGQELKIVAYDERDTALTPLANELISGLRSAQITPQKIEYISQVFIVYFENRGANYRALIDSQDATTGIYRLKTTLDHVDIKGEVDVAIKEIDTRFKLPVLKTQFTNI